MHTLPIIKIPHQSGAFVISDEPTHYNLSKSIVYSSLYMYMLCVWAKYNDMYHYDGIIGTISLT